MKIKNCPYCQYLFKRARVQNNSRYCPACNKKFHYVNGEVITTREYEKYLTDKQCADDLVALLVDRIKESSGIELDIHDLIAEKKFAYQLLERAKKFIDAQPDNFNVTPQEFIQEVIATMLKDNYWSSVTSLLFLTNYISQFAIKIWKQKQQAALVSSATMATSNDYRVFAR